MKHFILCLTISVGLLPVIAQTDDKSKPLHIVTAPSGKFYVEADPGLTLVMSNDANVRSRLPSPSGDEEENKMGQSDETAPLPIAFISPDEQWILCTNPVGYTDSSVLLLYRNKQDLQYELATPERFDTAAWKFFRREEKVDEKMIGIPWSGGAAQYRSIDFVDWSSDSGRLLIALSASIGPPEEGSGGSSFKSGIGWWLCYFNTSTGAFETTERLRQSNRGARKRWKDYSLTVPPPPTLPMTAEGIGKEGPWIPPVKKFERTDKRLNEIYAALLKKLEPAAREQLKQEQREWLIQRDTDAAIHANQRWSPFGKAALMEGKALATEARTTDLEKQLKP
jgi:Lysozyme inhibitor LprI